MTFLHRKYKSGLIFDENLKITLNKKKKSSK